MFFSCIYVRKCPRAPLNLRMMQTPIMQTFSLFLCIQTLSNRVILYRYLYISHTVWELTPPKKQEKQAIMN